MVSWSIITQNLAQYLGIFVFIINLFGVMMKIIIFSTRHSYRTIPCTFFMLMSAIGCLLHLFYATFGRVLTGGFNIDVTRTSLALCKLRQYSYTAVQIPSITFDWLSILDQFLVTSRSAHLRQLSTMKSAYYISTGVIVFFFLYGIPLLIASTIQSSACIIDNPMVVIYNSVSAWIFNVSIPMIMIIVFGTLTYRNMRAVQNVQQLQGVDRQFTLMVGAQACCMLITLLPYAIFTIYQIITSSQKKSVDQQGLETFVLNLISFIGIFRCGASFYIYLTISSRFRQEIKRYLCYCLRQENVVHPIHYSVKV